MSDPERFVEWDATLTREERVRWDSPRTGVHVLISMRDCNCAPARFHEAEHRDCCRECGKLWPCPAAPDKGEPRPARDPESPAP